MCALSGEIRPHVKGFEKKATSLFAYQPNYRGNKSFDFYINQINRTRFQIFENKFPL